MSKGKQIAIAVAVVIVGLVVFSMGGSYILRLWRSRRRTGKI
jgi:hypothetical protein